MTWYLTIRALCVAAFTAAIFAVIAAACVEGPGAGWVRKTGLTVAVVLTLVGCVLVGFGWGGEHP